ncbi:MAG: phosphatidylserine decarboxylase [Ruminococcus sp.]|nr:phosphatidylserine decarboxylase [Ruminococcus sp.]
MRYYDLEGNVFEKETSQDRLLDLLYETSLGKLFLKVLVSPAVSKAGGFFLSTSLSKALIKPFIKINNIDMSQYENRDFVSYNDFFTRKIKDGKREICKEDKALVSPADGKVSCYQLDENAVFEIKGGKYSLKSLLKCCDLAEKFKGGYAFVIRLTVDDYHRYCYPCDGEKRADRHIKGVFHTVNPVAFSHVEVFKENAREYCVIDSEAFGEVIQMEIGATMVGKISNNHKGKRRVSKGEEKGRFEFGGSTVVVLVKKDAVICPEELIRRTNEGAETIIRQGMKLAERA